MLYGLAGSPGAAAHPVCDAFWGPYSGRLQAQADSCSGMPLTARVVHNMQLAGRSAAICWKSASWHTHKRTTLAQAWVQGAYSRAWKLVGHDQWPEDHATLMQLPPAHPRAFPCAGCSPGSSSALCCRPRLCCCPEAALVSTPQAAAAAAAAAAATSGCDRPGQLRRGGSGCG